MVCIFCLSETEVYNSRPKARTPSVWRRRRCKACVAQFSTVELPDYEGSVIVSRTNAALEPFSRDRLFLSIYKALDHRQDSLASATQLTATVIGKSLRDAALAKGPLPAQDVAKIVHDTLKRYDPLAAHSYRAHHRTSLKS